MHIIIPGAQYGEARVDGQYAAGVWNSHIEITGGSRIELPRVPGTNTPDNLIGLRVQPAGEFRIAGQSHNGIGNWLWYRGTWYHAGPSYGVNPVIFDYDGVLTAGAPQYGSQGLRFFDGPGGRLYTGDETYADPVRRIGEWTRLGDVTVGQSGFSGIAIYNNRRYILDTGAIVNMRFTRENDWLAISYHNRQTNSLVLRGMNTATLAQFPLEPVVVDPIVAINKPCYLGWAEFVDPIHAVQPLGPGNCSWVVAGGLIRNRDSNAPFAQWVQGGTVEQIEQQAAQSALPAVAYWDSRRWPRYPQLPANSWLALQAYRRNTETSVQFEADMRVVIAQARDAGYRRIALVCQCYTSNLSLTSDIAGNVPVYARLARDFPQVTMLLVFSDQGRATGLNDHPELRPPWQQLANGITSTPAEEPPMIAPVVTVSNWTLDELKNGREFRVKDTNNPTEGYEFRVHVRNGSMYAEIKNAKGSASTGMVRPVKECPQPGPGPDPNPGPGPDPNPGPGPGPVGAATIKLNGQFFARENSERMTVIESSDFSLFKRYLDHDAATVDPVIAQRQALRFNTLRVWLLNWSVVAFRNGVEQDAIHPNQYPDFYPRLTQFVDFLADKGLCAELTVFTSTRGLMPDQSAQQTHLDRTVQAVQGRKNVILELVNENDQHDNAVFEGLVRPSGVIISHGSNGADHTGVRPPWDYELYHTNGLPEFQRKVGHNAMELADQVGVPCISNENTRYPDADSSPVHAYDAAMGGALLCAGSCFHSQGGKFSRVFDPTEEECARAWVAGAQSVPLEFQVGRYARHDDLNGPNVIRAYSRTLGDGRQHLIKIRP